MQVRRITIPRDQRLESESLAYIRAALLELSEVIHTLNFGQWPSLSEAIEIARWESPCCFLVEPSTPSPTYRWPRLQISASRSVGDVSSELTLLLSTTSMKPYESLTHAEELDREFDTALSGGASLYRIWHGTNPASTKEFSTSAGWAREEMRWTTGDVTVSSGKLGVGLELRLTGYGSDRDTARNNLAQLSEAYQEGRIDKHFGIELPLWFGQ